MFYLNVTRSAAPLNVVEELELRDGVLPKAEHVLLGFTGGSGQQVNDSLQKLANDLG